MKLLILDGNSIINRAFYAIPHLTAPDGLHTGGIYGFLVTFLRTLKAEKPDLVAVAFDLHAPTFRHKMFKEYKATRHKMPSELAEQMPVLKEILTKMEIPILEMEGYEADDIIGTVSRLCEEGGTDCRILTGDRDDLQLASEKTHILLTTTKGGKTETVEYDEKAVFEKYGLLPEALVEVKGLMGDSSDNIPGVRGIGEKTAIALIQKYKTVDGVYENLDDLKGAQLTKLTEGRDMAFLSRELGRICKEVPISSDISALKQKEYDKEVLSEIFRRLEFRTLAEELALPEKQEETVSYEAQPFSAYKGEKPLFLSFDGEAFFASDGDGVYALTKEEAFSVSPLRGHGLKNIMTMMQKEGKEAPDATFDTEIAAYILDPAESRYAPADLCEKYLSKRPGDFPSATYLLPALAEVLTAEMEKREQTALYFELGRPLVSVLSEMEFEGILAEGEKLSALSEKLSADLAGLETSIYASAGEVFNIQSPKQLGVILFEKLGLPAAKKTKTGYSTDAAVLEKLRGKHPIIDDILEYRTLSKLKSTYAEGLLPMINEETGRIHTTFHQTVTATGRLSSAEPNLQNIPVKTELGREIRKVFTAKEGYVLVDADYSQIELRVLAHMAGDENMIESFRENADIHTKTASQIFGVAEFMVTPEMRMRAKTINFGIIYGMSDFTLSQDLKTSRKEAKNYIDSYFYTYRGVGDFMEKMKDFARENGYGKSGYECAHPRKRRRYYKACYASGFPCSEKGRAAGKADFAGSRRTDGGNPQRRGRKGCRNYETGNGKRHRDGGAPSFGSGMGRKLVQGKALRRKNDYLAYRRQRRRKKYGCRPL